MNLTPKTSDALQAAETFREAAQLNREDPYRQGGILRLPAYGQAVMTGDLHGHQKNLEKLKHYAMLERVAARHVILHELIHSDLGAPSDVDDSHALLLQAAEYKCRFPDQVHFLQSNHELSQLTNYLIAKNGRIVIHAFSEAVLGAFGPGGEAVLEAINEFITSFPLAIRTENRVWLSHSLPNAHEMIDFDPNIFDRPPTRRDLETSRSIFGLVWGRRHTPEQIEALARALEIDAFIIGHQPQETGYCVLFDRLIILASNHSHGVFLPFDLSKPQTAGQLVGNIRKFVAVA